MAGVDYKELANSIKDSLSSSVIKEKITSDLGLQGKNGKYYCSWHNDGKTPNVSYYESGKYFKCFSCGKVYDIITHYMEYYGLGFVDAVLKINDDFHLGLETRDRKHELATKSVPKENKQYNVINDKAMEYITKRGLNFSNLDGLPIKGDGDYVIFEYYDQYGNFICNKKRKAEKTKKNERGFSWINKPKGFQGLYNMHRVDVTKKLVICEGEFDCLALIKAGYSNVVSPNAGASSYEWIENNYDWLMQFNEIVVWYDYDDAGLDGAKTISSRLDNCVGVVYCQEANDINELLYRKGKEEVLRWLESVEEVSVRGAKKFSQIKRFNIFEAEKVKTGIKSLDEYIHGLVFGTLNIITGLSGSGKSTLINQMCIGEPLKAGYKVALFSGELSDDNVKGWLYDTMADGDDYYTATSQDGYKYRRLKNDFYDKFDVVADQFLTLYDYDEIGTDEDTIINFIEQMVKRQGCRVFILDNYMMIDLNKNNDKYEAEKKFVKKLKDMAKKHKLIIHLVAHPRKTDLVTKINKMDVAGSANITNLADYVMGVHRTTSAEKEKYCDELEKCEREGKKKPDNPRDGSLMLFKDRPTGKSDKEFTLFFNADRKRFYEEVEELKNSYYKDKIKVEEKTKKCVIEIPEDVF